MTGILVDWAMACVTLTVSSVVSLSILPKGTLRMRFGRQEALEVLLWGRGSAHS